MSEKHLHSCSNPSKTVFKQVILTVIYYHQTN